MGIIYFVRREPLVHALRWHYLRVTVYRGEWGHWGHGARAMFIFFEFSRRQRLDCYDGFLALPFPCSQRCSRVCHCTCVRRKKGHHIDTGTLLGRPSCDMSHNGFSSFYHPCHHLYHHCLGQHW